MTIKPEVLAAMLSIDDCHLTECDDDWQTLRAELLAMDAEITEAVKDARRYRWLLANAQTIEGRQDWYWWADDADVTPLTERIDNAMHNSAREAGE
jgi:hypothetical protein